MRRSSSLHTQFQKKEKPVYLSIFKPQCTRLAPKLLPRRHQHLQLTTSVDDLQQQDERRPIYMQDGDCINPSAEVAEPYLVNKQPIERYLFYVLNLRC